MAKMAGLRKSWHCKVPSFDSGQATALPSDVRKRLSPSALACKHLGYALLGRSPEDELERLRWRGATAAQQMAKPIWLFIGFLCKAEWPIRRFGFVDSSIRRALPNKSGHHGTLWAEDRLYGQAVEFGYSWGSRIRGEY